MYCKTDSATEWALLATWGLRPRGRQGPGCVVMQADGQLAKAKDTHGIRPDVGCWVQGKHLALYDLGPAPSAHGVSNKSDNQGYPQGCDKDSWRVCTCQRCVN